MVSNDKPIISYAAAFQFSNISRYVRSHNFRCLQSLKNPGKRLIVPQHVASNALQAFDKLAHSPPLSSEIAIIFIFQVNAKVLAEVFYRGVLLSERGTAFCLYPPFYQIGEESLWCFSDCIGRQAPKQLRGIRKQIGILLKFDSLLRI